MDFERLKLFDGTFWGIFLHWDQTVPGRVYFRYKDEADDLLSISQDAFMELHQLGNKITSALSESFHPDYYNYYSLDNMTRHLHVHIIPRYSKEIHMFGLQFKDIAFGKSYKRNPNFIVEEKILIEIKNEIIKHIE